MASRQLGCVEQQKQDQKTRMPIQKRAPLQGAEHPEPLEAKDMLGQIETGLADLKANSDELRAQVADALSTPSLRAQGQALLEALAADPSMATAIGPVLDAAQRNPHALAALTAKDPVAQATAAVAQDPVLAEAVAALAVALLRNDALVEVVLSKAGEAGTHAASPALAALRADGPMLTAVRKALVLACQNQALRVWLLGLVSGGRVPAGATDGATAGATAGGTAHA